MRQAEALLTAPGLDNPHGLPAYSRRLTDKILAAFNHAYSLGEKPIAEQLRAALAVAEEQALLGGGKDRRGTTAVAQAELWAAFVDARDAYNAFCEERPLEPEQAKAAYDKMEQAFRDWSYS